MPITRSGRDVAAASSVIGIDDVLEARTACAGQRLVGRAKELLLRVGVLDDRLDQQIGLGELVDRADAPEHLVRLAARPSRAACRGFAAWSRARARPRPADCRGATTSRPDAATTCAIPAPIWPAPTTRTRSKLIGRGYFVPAALVAGAAASENARTSARIPRPITTLIQLPRTSSLTESRAPGSVRRQLSVVRRAPSQVREHPDRLVEDDRLVLVVDERRRRGDLDLAADRAFHALVDDAGGRRRGRRRPQAAAR